MSRADVLLRALTDNAPVNWWRNGRECAYCKAAVMYGEDLENPDKHTPECPWRLAKEYVQGKEA